MRYTVLNLIILLIVVSLVRPWRKDYPLKAAALTAVALVVLTLIFDNVIILARIVAYNPSYILGLKLGAAPVEDFAYSFVAALFIPYLWNRGKRDVA